MSGRCETISMNGKEYYTFPYDARVYEKLANGCYRVAFVRHGSKSSTKTTNTTQSKK